MSARFYQRPTEIVARELLGKLLVRSFPNGRVLVVRLTEVESYLGVDDPACHTFGGRRTSRVSTMWGQAGRAYIYLVYGMHHCLNVVTVGPNDPQAVLVRGAVPVVGREEIVRRRGRSRNLLDGPGKLCQGLGLNRDQDGTDLCTTEGRVWLSDDGVRAREADVIRGPRVGVAYAGEAAAWPLRLRWRSAVYGDGGEATT